VVGAMLVSGPRAVRLQKQLVTAWEDLPLRAAVQRGIEVFAESFRTDEPARMMAELQEKMLKRKLA
jgi:enoyl-CoA hydratase